MPFTLHTLTGPDDVIVGDLDQPDAGEDVRAFLRKHIGPGGTGQPLVLSSTVQYGACFTQSSVILTPGDDPEDVADAVVVVARVGGGSFVDA